MKTRLQYIMGTFSILLVPNHSHQASDYFRFTLQYILDTHLFHQSLQIYNHEDLSGRRNLSYLHVPSTRGPSTYGPRPNLRFLFLSSVTKPMHDLQRSSR